MVDEEDLSFEEEMDDLKMPRADITDRVLSVAMTR
jgi:hypothetical protein